MDVIYKDLFVDSFIALTLIEPGQPFYFKLMHFFGGYDSLLMFAAMTLAIGAAVQFNWIVGRLFIDFTHYAEPSKSIVAHINRYSQFLQRYGLFAAAIAFYPFWGALYVFFLGMAKLKWWHVQLIATPIGALYYYGVIYLDLLSVA